MSNKFECSVAAVERGEPMFATASRVRGWLLVEVRGAWRSDAVFESRLGEHISQAWRDELQQNGIRVVCIRSFERSDDAGVRLYTCSAPVPGGESAVLWRRDIDGLADVVQATVGLAAGVEPGVGWERDTEPIYLVCTNGRHDQCCANQGRPLLRELRESRWTDRVWESSHIGGDRFAANLVELPQSLYFGRVDPDIAPALLAGLDDGRLDLERFRGRTSLSVAQQAVEHFARQEFGLDGVEDVAVGRRSDDGSYPVHLADRSVAVRIRRRLTIVDTPLTCSGTAQQSVPVFTLQSIG